ncbi:galanin peptides isoform X1 [Micropterus dolomieu]|uniref:galanin peptides isoform X1 n=1 Tax=Micropterus dolomieu TaxID=147949 RepID=UPI001E8E245F|nr:galanin peptides isoform X1 [Micropterus dolomieu]
MGVELIIEQTISDKVGCWVLHLCICVFFKMMGIPLHKEAKEKRGWTLNSAGYLLGPHGIDGHRTLGDKPGLAGKRDMGQEEDFRTGALRIADGDIIHTVIDFLSYLKLKEMGALDSLPSSVTSDELANP